MGKSPLKNFFNDSTDFEMIDSHHLENVTILMHFSMPVHFIIICASQLFYEIFL